MEHIETLIIGGGQSGLATAYHLAQRGRPFVILEGLDRIGDNWRRHYDSLTLFSPRKLDGLPGLDFPGPAMSLPTKDEVADYLELYAERNGLAVRTGVWVERLVREDGGYVATTTAGDIRAENVVVCAGHGEGHVPAFASELDPSILQLHSTEYRNPAQLQPGPVLVVGAAHSGADIACELAATRPTILSGRRTGELPFRLDGPLIRYGEPFMRFVGDRVISLDTPIGRKVQDEFREHGGPLIDPRQRAVEEAGVRWVEERTEGVRDGMPVLADGEVVEVTNVVWCTGLRHDFSWIDLDLGDEDGWPDEFRGVSSRHDGLYFMGLTFQQAFSSMLIHGAGRDGEFIAEHIHRRTAPVGTSSAR